MTHYTDWHCLVVTVSLDDVKHLEPSRTNDCYMPSNLLSVCAVCERLLLMFVPYVDVAVNFCFEEFLPPHHDLPLSLIHI